MLTYTRILGHRSSKSKLPVPTFCTMVATSSLAIQLLRLCDCREVSATNVQRPVKCAWNGGCGRRCPLATRLSASLGEDSHRGDASRGITKIAHECGLLNKCPAPTPSIAP